MRDDFRTRAICAGTATAALALLVLLLLRWDARWFFDRLTGSQARPVLGAGLFFFAASAWAVFRRHYNLARVFGVGEIVLLLVGWGLAQSPYLAYPNYTVTDSAAPIATIRFLLIALPFGAIVLVPSLWYLFRVFKSQRSPVLR